MLEHERESPVHYAQIGACALRREDDGSVRSEILRVEHILLAGKQRLSKAVWWKLEDLASAASIKLLDLMERDVVSAVLSDFDLRNKAGGKVRFAMRNLEAEVIEQILPRLSMERWLIADGSLLFDPILRRLSTGEEIRPVIGVSKNSAKIRSLSSGGGRAPSGVRSTSCSPTCKLSIALPSSARREAGSSSGMCGYESKNTWITR